MARVESSIDGVNWTTLVTYSSDQGQSGSFSNAVVALNSEAINQPSVRIRFRYTASDDRYWAINNVTVTEYSTISSAQVVINTQPSTQNNTVCVGQNLPSLSVSATGTGEPSYQWYFSTTANNFSGTLIDGATQSTYTIPNNTASSRYYFCQVTYGDCSLRSEVSGLNVISNGPAITTQPSSGFTAYVCEGGVYILSVVSTSANVSYQWYSRVTTGGPGTLIPGATASSYQVPTNVSSALYYYCVLTNNCGTTTSSTSRRVRVTVMSTKPSTANQNVCLNSAITPLTVAMTGSFVSYTYAWYSSAVPSNTGGTLISGATGASFTPSSAVASSLYYYTVVSVSANNTVQCTITSPVSGLITVSPTAVGGTINGEAWCFVREITVVSCQ